jgi:hypothetical protein
MLTAKCVRLWRNILFPSNYRLDDSNDKQVGIIGSGKL